MVKEAVTRFVARNELGRRHEATFEKAKELVGRPDSHLSEDRIKAYLDSGAWSLDTFVDLLEQHARTRPSDPAVVDQSGNAITWSQLLERSQAFGAGLLDLGYHAGDCLGVQLPNWSEFAITVLGSAYIGVRPVFIHIPYRSYEMSYILELTGARGLLLPSTYRNMDHLGLGMELRERLPLLSDLFVVRGEQQLSAGRNRMFDFDEIVQAGMGAELNVAPPLSTDLFVLMFTSGTTNRPKGVMHLHANLLTACRNYVGAYGLLPEDRWLIVTPLTHLTAFGIAFLGGSLAGGSAVTLLEAWDVDKALELIERDRITHFVGAPPMLIDMARSPGLKERDLSSLRFMMYAGAPCPIEILRKLHDQLGCKLAVFYGWTEGLAHTYSGLDDPLEITSVTIGRTGKGWETKVVDDEGNEVREGERGEFWGRGPNLSPGYYRQPQFMAERFHPEGWFMSGDVVTKNKDGTFTFVARKDDEINRGGQKVDPREVEELLYELPEVSNAVVVAMPDARLGQRGCVFVVPSPGANVTLELLNSHLEKRGLAKYKWPERLEVVDSLPMTPTGKIMRYALRDIVSQGDLSG